MQKKQRKNDILFVLLIAGIASLPYLNKEDIVNKDCLTGIMLNFFTSGISYICFFRMFGVEYIGLLCSALYTLSTFRIYKLLMLNDICVGIIIVFIPIVIYAFYILTVKSGKHIPYMKSLATGFVGYIGILIGHLLSLTNGEINKSNNENGLTLAQLAIHFFDVKNDFSYENNVLSVSCSVGIGMILCITLYLFLACWFCGCFSKAQRSESIYVKSVVLIACSLLVLCTGIIGADNKYLIDYFMEWATALSIFAFGYCLYYFQKNNLGLLKGMVILAIVGLTTSSFVFIDAASYAYRYGKLNNSISLNGVDQLLSQPIIIGKENMWRLLESPIMLLILVTIVLIRYIGEKNDR